MIALQLSPPIEVEHKTFGKGNAVIYTDYGVESDAVFVVILHSTGGIMHFRASEVRATRNYTMGRGKWEELKQKLDQQ